MKSTSIHFAAAKGQLDSPTYAQGKECFTLSTNRETPCILKYSKVQAKVSKVHTELNSSFWRFTCRTNFLSNNLHSHSAFAYRGWAAVVAPSTVNVGKGPIFPQTAEPTNPAPAGLLLAMWMWWFSTPPQSLDVLQSFFPHNVPAKGGSISDLESNKHEKESH